MPKVSVLMPLYNGRKYIEECLQSVQAQTFTDWEFIIVNDFGSDDGCAEVVKAYAAKDPRIILVQPDKRLGLASSLNLGLEMAKGEYVARVDVDDPSYPERFEKQVTYLDKHPDITVCSSWQQSVTPQNSCIQKVASEPEELKAAMMFGCEISHCGVMLRKSEFDKHGWKYDPNFLSEDYELWTRIIFEGAKLFNIPEVLVNHRWGFGNISITKGESLRNEVRSLSKRMVQRLGIDTSKYDDILFSGWRNKPTEQAKSGVTRFLKQGYGLLREIEKKNIDLRLFDQRALQKILLDRWNWIRESCGITFEKFECDSFPKTEAEPVVSVVLPAFNSVKDISRSIDSVIRQTFTQWELLVINDCGSDDGTAEIVKMYTKNDPRIRLIQAAQRLGLAESLNLGICEARGKYIARLDADDTAYPQRFEKQVALMEARPEVGVCGTWQHHYGKNIDYIHKAEPDEAQLRTNLLFWCDLCHSTLMLRKEAFVKNNLFYDSHAIAEDFELWTRAMQYMKFVNIPEVLGDYCEDGGITHSKYQAINTESGEITARTLKQYLNIDVPKYQYALLNSWDNDYYNENKQEKLNQLEAIFREIWERNEELHYFDRNALLQTLAKKWHWTKERIDWRTERYKVSCIDEVFKENKVKLVIRRYRNFIRNNPSRKVRIKKVIKKLFYPLAWFVRKVLRACFAWIIDEIKQSIECWTWERYCQIERKIAQSISAHEYIPYYPGQKIRVVFLFQVAAFWPSLESLYYAMKNDARYDVKLVCYDEPIDDTIKTDTARDYLIKNNYNFIPWEKFDIEDFSPHIVFVQTPYDSNRRYIYKKSSLTEKGYRVVHISYGIEIGNTRHSRRDNFIRSSQNSWKIYTLSPTMKDYYLQYTKASSSVCAVGLPRFDALYHKERFPQHDEVVKLANGRKVVLWKVHFPKVIPNNGKQILVTPDIGEYVKFAENIEQFDDLFFVFMPHPRFVEFNDDETVRRQTIRLMRVLGGKQNVFIDTADDYRPSLLNADAIIGDRSTVMIEAAVVGVPVMYISNAQYCEKMTDALQPIIDSYYQGTRYEDMVAFIEQFRRGEDPKKEQREAALKLCVPYFDGKCGQRIADDIAASLEKENSSTNLDKRIDELEHKVNALVVNESSACRSDIERQFDHLERTLDARIRKGELQQKEAHEELHKHIDYTYRDIMIVLEKQLEFVGKHGLVLQTDYPCAVDSLDTIHPRGTANDNTRYPRFIKKCETVFKKDRGLSFLDLGCSGGGMVLDAIIRGHMAIGLEGSDWSLVRQRAEWRLLRNNLFTCDITKPFSLVSKDGNECKKFDVITAWDVLEHIAAEDLKQLFTNISNHLADDGIFVASIACWDDIDPKTEVNWHVTVKPKEWWQERFQEFGFEELDGVFDVEDMARGGINHPVCYRSLLDTPSSRVYEFAVLRKNFSDRQKAISR